MGMSMAGGGGSRNRRGRRNRGVMAEINVTPLVDVMLVLLIIFMVAAPLMTAGVPVDLPDSRANALEQDPLQITISLDGQGAIYIDEDAVAEGTLPDRLLAMPRGEDGKPPLVTLRADRSLDYGRVMAVMGELNRAGFNSISLVTNSSVSAP